MRDEVSSERTKILALAGVVLLVLAVQVLLALPPATGYEGSIYSVYPWYFWVAVVGAILAGQLVVLRTALADGHRPLDLSVGLLLVALPVLALSLVPYVRGYPIYGRADVLTHVGFVRDLPESGVNESIYPPMHLQVQSLATATGTGPNAVINLLPAAFTVAYLGGLYLLVGQLFDDGRRARFAAGVALFPAMGVVHVHAVPYTLSLLLVPLLLFLLIAEQRTRATAVRVMLPVALVGVLFYHPLTAVFVLCTGVVYLAIKRVRGIDHPGPAPTTVASLSVVVFGGWYLNFPGIVARFRRVVRNVLYPGDSESPLEATTGTVARTSPDIADLLRIAAVKYGADLLVFGFAMAFLAVAAVAWWRDGPRPNAFVLLAGGIAAAFAGTTVLFFVFDFVGGFGRPLAYGRIFALPLAGALWYRLRTGPDRPAVRTVAAVSLALILLVMTGLTTASVFTSPIVAEGNEQVTAMELDGTEWTFAHRNESLLVDEFGIDQYRFEHVHAGFRNGSSTVRDEGTVPPDHFNYSTHETLGDSYEADRYLLLTRKGRLTYLTRFPDYRRLWRFYPREFERLQRDRTVARIYANGEYDAYHIEGTRNASDGTPDA
jgi:hypothetical protein